LKRQKLFIINNLFLKAIKPHHAKESKKLGQVETLKLSDKEGRPNPQGAALLQQF
jgi:hypothetical protein